MMYSSLQKCSGRSVSKFPSDGQWCGVCVDGGAEERQEREVQLTFPEPGANLPTGGGQRREQRGQLEPRRERQEEIVQRGETAKATREAECRQEGRGSAHTCPLLATGSTAKQGREAASARKIV